MQTGNQIKSSRNEVWNKHFKKERKDFPDVTHIVGFIEIRFVLICILLVQLIRIDCIPVNMEDVFDQHQRVLYLQ